MVDGLGVHWCVHESLLTPYPPRCETCGGSGDYRWPVLDPELDKVTEIEMRCPKCKGTGRSGNDTEALQASQRASQCQECGGEGKVRTVFHDYTINGPAPRTDVVQQCPACGGSGRRSHD